MNKTLLAATLAGVFTAGIASTPATHAEDAMTAAKTKCYGIAMAGKNDCKTASGSHSCQGQSTVNKDPNEWKYVASPEACKAEGGALTVEDAMKMMKK